MSDRELRDVCRVLMPIIGKRFREKKGATMTFDVALPSHHSVYDGSGNLLASGFERVCRMCGSKFVSRKDGHACGKCTEQAERGEFSAS